MTKIGTIPGEEEQSFQIMRKTPAPQAGYSVEFLQKIIKISNIHQ
jgi:hypothetical protein